MSKQVYLLGVCIVLLGWAFVVTTWLVRPGPGVHEENAERLRAGMRLAEVELILGSRGYYNRETASWFWLGKAGAVHIYPQSNAPDRVWVVEWWYLDGRPARQIPDNPPPGRLSRLRTWLGW